MTIRHSHTTMKTTTSSPWLLLITLLPSAHLADVVSYDFETNPGGLAGSAQIVAGQLQLTTNANSLQGAFHIPAIADSSNGFTATFNYTIINDAGNPADGFSFSYGPIPPGTTTIGAEEGWPGITPLMSWEFDTYENNSVEVGVSIAVDNTNLPGAFTNGNLLEGASTVTGTATISWYPGQGASFLTTGLLTNADFTNIPTSFIGDEAYTFALAARTGGLNQEVLIDNLVITTGNDDNDGDGLPNSWEELYGLDPDDNGENPNNNNEVGDPNNGPDGDPDADNLTNLEELTALTSPTDNDFDDDLLLDGDEVKGLAGARPATDPKNPDSDGDGLDDFVESNSGVFVDLNDTGTNPMLIDTDSDNTPDRREVLKGTDPIDPNDFVVTSTATRYEQDFDGFPNGTIEGNLFDGSDFRSVAGNHGVQDDELMITRDGSGSVHSSFRIPAIVNSSAGWVATFDLTLFDSVGANLPADGLSFVYGDIPAFNPDQPTVNQPDAHGQAEEGWGAADHLAFRIDTWENGAGEAGFDISSNVGGANVNHANDPTIPLADGQTIDTVATVSWDPVNGASLSTELTGPIFTDVPTPGFTGNDAYTFGFTARTGGATQTVLIDNLVIGSPPSNPLVITDITANRVDNKVLLSWTSSPGRTYALDVSTTLQEGPAAEGHWLEVDDAISSGGEVTNYEDTDNPNGSVKRFYRVRDVTN